MANCLVKTVSSSSLMILPKDRPTEPPLLADFLATFLPPLPATSDRLITISPPALSFDFASAVELASIVPDLFTPLFLITLYLNFGIRQLGVL